MHLEDHAGDIVAKAREAVGLTLEEAAKIAGMTPTLFEGWEKTGTLQGDCQWLALGQALKLDGARLKKIAEGWVPATPDLSLWREIRRFTTTEEGITVHCYLVWDEVCREAALFDTGWKAQPVMDCLQENGLALRHIFITHSHPDHLGALGEIRAAFPKALLHTSSKSAPPQHRNRANDFIHLGSLRITNRDTPGHAEDGATYIVGNWPEDAPHVALVGDAIFAGSMGRGNQSADLARQKVREQILSLPGETLIGAGHGPWTTVGQEKESNPFF